MASDAPGQNNPKPLRETTLPPLLINPRKRIPLLKTATHHPIPEPTLPVQHSKTHPAQAPDASSSSATTASIFFIGTATTVLSYGGGTSSGSGGGIRLLTDPNLLHAGDHVHLGPGVRATRRTEPAVADLGAVPPVDAVLLSHYHEDHFDREVEARLSRDVPILTTAHAAGCLTRGRDEPFRAVRAGKGRRMEAVRVTGLPGKHVPPGPLAVVNKLLGAVPPTNGWLVELGWVEEAAGGGDDFRSGYRIYISGDTLYVDELKEIPARLRGDRIDLMLVHLGGTTIPGPDMPLVMVTMDAEQGVRLMRLVDPDVTVPIHFDDYDVFCSPLDDFKKEVEAAGFGDRVVYLDRGDEYRFAVPET
ncbi:f62432b0-ad00-4cc8-af2e-7181657d07b3 [Thermothielavioides terrestris]|uniref:F62432b0-ad00-4cc8-af2e-7181657d07b3 n=1 Tax=Thermothielavioides terrestris TaxID=2587410 RepID=A0A446BNG8_9PEZI|nr:f62432b0-ad00-4cc8-af2e-7181657d07b3 [Thermothielavioides terrestris]